MKSTMRLEARRPHAKAASRVGVRAPVPRPARVAAHDLYRVQRLGHRPGRYRVPIGPLPAALGRPGHALLRAMHPPVNVGPPVVAPVPMIEPPASLPEYQRELLIWAASHQMPDLDVKASGAYERARRQLWYSHRAVVLGFLGGGAGLGFAEVDKVAADIDGFTVDERRRFTVWLLGSGEEKTKLAAIQGMGKGKVFEFWTSSKQALEESSVLPRTSSIAFKFATPPAVGKIINLPQAEAVLDYWEVTANAYIEATILLRQAEIEDAREKGYATGGLEDSLARWRGGGPESVRAFVAKTAAARIHVDQGKGTLAGLRSADRDEEAGQSAKPRVQATANQAAASLAAAQGLLAGQGPEAERFARGFESTERQLSDRARKALAEKAPAPWWVSAAESVHGAMRSFAEGLKNPENWKLALELGLEIAGTLASGGLALAARVAAWLVSTGTDLSKQVGAVVSAIKLLTSKDGLASLLPVDRLFSLVRLETLAVDALFGKVRRPEAESEENAETEKKPKPRAGKKEGGFARAAAALGRRIASLYRGARDGVFGLLERLDLSHEAWFAPFVNAWAKVARLGKKAAKLGGLVEQGRLWIKGARGRLAGYIEGLEARVGGILDVLKDPGAMVAAWSRGLVTAGMGFLLRLLITKPPSAALKIAFRLASSVVDLDPAAIIAWVRSNVPGADAMIGSIEGTASEVIGGLVAKPAADAHAHAATFVASTAEPVIAGARQAFDGALSKLSTRVESLAGTGPAKRQAGVGVEQDDEPDTARKKPAGRVRASRNDRSRRLERRAGTPDRQVRRQPETVLILVQQNAVDFSRRTELIREIGGPGATQAPDERFLDLTSVEPQGAVKQIRTKWLSKSGKRTAQRMHVVWGSFELFGTPLQLRDFFTAAKQVLEGKARVGQGPQLLPDERSSKQLLDSARHGRSREAIVALSGDGQAIRDSLYRWLIAMRALGHVERDQYRILWSGGASDFAWQQFPEGRGIGLFDPDQQRSSLRKTNPELFQTVERQGNLPVLMLCYEFVAWVAMRSGAIEASTATEVFRGGVAEGGLLGKAFYGAEAGMYQMLGAAGSGHRPFYVRPESRILTDDRFPSSGVGARRGFFGQPRVGSAVFVWKNTGTAETDQFTLSHVGLCVAPGMMVSLTYGRLALESWDQLLARYNTRNEPIEGLSYGAPLV